MSNTVLVIGTGTIGEPLIGMLASAKNDLGIDELFFYKRTPLIDEVAKVESLCRRGARLVVTNSIERQKFESLGHKVEGEFADILELADVIIDCTPAGNKMKEDYYEPLRKKQDKKRVFIAQGSEKDFGTPFAYGINNEILASSHDYLQVVSCNTHNISCLLKSLSPDFSNIVMGDFVCIRRANDISQRGNFIASPEVGAHSDLLWGTHHARDAADLISTVANVPNIYSSAMKVNSQYMHVIRFTIVVDGQLTTEDVVDMLQKNDAVCLTEKTQAARVFSFGRDHGQYGRIYNHTVIAKSTLQVQCGESSDGSMSTRVTGFCFTPQDGNSLISSCVATLYGLHGERYVDYVSSFSEMLYNEL